ncbi:SDR family oxidoreductase [Aquabacter cavernae]|uniref:SDR family oxidoreductase n=1 Tax=Aquabacter cavernae TaxID=2496029 RepID=UPI000F8EC8E0|nr:SDR family NAD(P)-dependent oxidoreductase [Aquabacter cavernae]
MTSPYAHPALSQDRVAVVTGGASGLGLAAAQRFAALGMKVCIADRGADRLQAAADLIGGDVLAIDADVSRRADLERLERAVRARFSRIDVLMNNAGIQPGSAVLSDGADWRRILDVNLFGVIEGTQVFLPGMIAQGSPALVINTGSKQGITTPPGDPAYNVSKAGVKVFTEALEHDLRNRPDCQVRAHLFIPGFVFTPLAVRGRTEKPAGAWTADETVDFMLGRVDAGDFYVLCPDNDVTRAMDEKRILWAAGDLAHNRPPLSRWHPDYRDEFDAYLKS